MRFAPCLALVALSSCSCGEEPPSPIVDAGIIGDGDPVDPDGGPPLDRDAGPVVCEEDAFEENDVRADAVALAQQTPVSGTFCGEDDDWFSVQAGAGCSVTASLTFDAADGDLDVLLFDPDGQLVGSAQTLGDSESLNVTAAEAGLYAARIRGGGRDIVPYAFSLQATCLEDLSCPADDALEDNDDAQSASTLATGVAADAIACPGDQDMFSMPASVGCIADLNVTFTDADGDIDVELLRADGSILGASRTVTDNERVLKVVSEPGLVYRVVLFGSDADGNTYRASVNEICENELSCPGDDPFEPNDLIAEAVRLDKTHDQALGVLCGEDEDFYDVIPTSACRLTSVLSLDTAEGDLDLELTTPDGTRIALSNTTSAQETLDYDAANASRVILRVFSFSNPAGAAQGYRLTTTTTCP